MMRTNIALRVLGAVLCVAGALAVRGQATLARVEADAWQRLATLHFEEAPAPAAGTLVDVLGTGREAARRTALTEYWLGRYAQLVDSRGGNSSDPDVLFVAANAAYRVARRDGAIGPAGARQLDPVLQGYAAVLRADPGHRDAAFNFEYVARERAYLERMRPAAAVPDEAPEPSGAGPIRTTDLPRGPTVHGVPGGPPVNVTIEEFEILIPRESGEEQAPPGQAEGGRLRRKG